MQKKFLKKFTENLKKYASMRPDIKGIGLDAYKKAIAKGENLKEFGLNTLKNYIPRGNNPQEIAIDALKKIIPKKPNIKSSGFDSYILDKFGYFGLNGRIAYAIIFLSVAGYAFYFFIHDKDGYYRRMAYDTQDSNKSFKYLTSNFANNNPIILGISLPFLFGLARKLELTHGSAFLLKLTFLTMCINALSMTLSNGKKNLLPKSLALPIDQVSKPDGRYQMGPHALIASYASFALLKHLKFRVSWIAVLAIIDAILSQKGYWGGYLSGILAYMIF